MQSQDFLPTVAQEILRQDIELPCAYRQRNVIVMLDLKNYSKMTRQIIAAADKADLTPAEKFNITQKVGELVRSCFNPTLEKLIKDGADLLKFGGDSIIISWPLSEVYPLSTDEDQEEPEIDKSNDKKVTWAALKSCLEVFDLIKRIGAKGSKISKIFADQSTYTPLGMHGSFHLGFLDTVCLGQDDLPRAEASFFGNDLNLVGETLQLANFSDEFIITQDVADLLDLRGFCASNAIKPTVYKGQDCFIIGPQHLPALEQLFKTLDRYEPPLDAYPRIPLDKLKPFVDDTVFYRIKEKPAINASTFEQLRDITCLFIGVSDPNHPNYSTNHYENLAHIESINQLYTIVIESLETYKGILRQFSNDDKGITLICFFGFPPSIHENTCIPALKCANEIQTNLQRHVDTKALLCNIGVATGRVYSGAIGNNINSSAPCDLTRFDHAVLGEALNMAARLMGLHHETVDSMTNRILCDEKTCTAGKSLSVKAEMLPVPIQLKGWEKALNFYTVSSSSGYSQSNLDVSKKDEKAAEQPNLNLQDPQFDEIWKQQMKNWSAGDSLAGKNKNRSTATLTGYIENPSDRPGGPRKASIKKKMGKVAPSSNIPPVSCIVLEGVTGAGKTHVMKRMIDYSLEQTWLVWQSPSFESESKTPYFAVRRFANLFYRTITTNPEICQNLDLVFDQKTEIQFYQSSQFMELMEKLKINYSKARFVITQLIAGNDRSSSVNLEFNPDKFSEDLIEIFCPLLTFIGSFKKLLLVLDDVQWQDSFSWRLTNVISHLCAGHVFLLVLSRPPDEYIEPSLRRLYENMCFQSTTAVHPIGKVPMSIILENLTNMFESNLGPGKYNTLVDRIAKVIYERTGGSAMAVSCMINHITGIVQSKDFDLNNIKNLDIASIIPKNSAAIIIAQFDKLEPEFRMLLTTGALLGQQFNVEDVAGINGTSMLTNDQITALDVYKFVEFTGDSCWKFKHCLVQSYVVATLTDERKLGLHTELAKYYEVKLEKHPGMRSQLLPIIHQQYTAAKNEEKVFSYGLMLLRVYHKLGMTVETERLYRSLPKAKLDELPVDEQVNLNVLICACADKNGTFLTSKEVGVNLIIKTLELLGIPYPKGKFKLILFLLKLLKENQKGWLEDDYLPLLGLPFMQNLDLPKTHRCLTVLQKITDTCCKIQTAKHNTIDTLVLTFLNLNAHLAFSKMNFTDPESEKVNNQNLSCKAINYVMMGGLAKYNIRKIILDKNYWHLPEEEDKLLKYLDQRQKQTKKDEIGYGTLLYANAMAAAIGNTNFVRGIEYYERSGMLTDEKAGTIADLQTIMKMYGGMLYETGRTEYLRDVLRRWFEIEETLAVEGASLDKESISPFSYNVLLIYELYDVNDQDVSKILEFLILRLEAELKVEDKLKVAHSWVYLALIVHEVCRNGDAAVSEKHVRGLLNCYQTIAKKDPKQISVTCAAQVLLILRCFMMMCVFRPCTPLVRDLWTQIFRAIFLSGFKKPDFVVLIGLRQPCHYVYKGLCQLDRTKYLTFCQKMKRKRMKGNEKLKAEQIEAEEITKALQDWAKAEEFYDTRPFEKHYSATRNCVRELTLFYGKKVPKLLSPERIEELNEMIVEFYSHSNFEVSKNLVEGILDY